MKNKTKYLNTTARVLSNDTAESQGKEPRVIKVHFDMPNCCFSVSEVQLL